MPGAAGCLKWLANSIRSWWDTAAMRVFSRALGRWDMLRVAAAGLGVALAVVGLGLAGLYVSLAAGFAAAVALICYLACGALVAGPRYRSVEAVVGPLWRQVGAIGAAALLAVIVYAAFRGDFVAAKF